MLFFSNHWVSLLNSWGWGMSFCTGCRPVLLQLGNANQFLFWGLKTWHTDTMMVRAYHVQGRNSFRGVNRTCAFFLNLSINKVTVLSLLTHACDFTHTHLLTLRFRTIFSGTWRFSGADGHPCWCARGAPSSPPLANKYLLVRQPRPSPLPVTC